MKHKNYLIKSRDYAICQEFADKVKKTCQFQQRCLTDQQPLNLFLQDKLEMSIKTAN